MSLEGVNPQFSSEFEGAELLGSVFNLETKALNFTKPDPDLAKCVKTGVEEEIKTHFDINPKAARMGEYWTRRVKSG